MHRNVWRAARHLLMIAVACSGAVAQADEAYPTRAIRVVVPYPAGGNTDIIARDVMKDLAERLKQPVVIDNKPGANGIVGTDFVAKAAPDGYTLGVVIGAYANAPALYRNLPYKNADLVPVSQLSRTSLVIVSAWPGIQQFDDLLKAGRDGAGAFNFASSGVASAAHLLGERLVRGTGMRSVTHVSYKGSADAISDLVAGRVGFMFDAVSAMGPQIRAGRLKALAVTGASRSSLLPDVPTLKELGLPDMEAYAWAGVLAPARTPPAIVQQLSAELAKVLESPALRAKLAAISTEVVGSSPEQFGRFIAEEQKINGGLIQQLGVKLD
jgi:tripartite-type tricarboxylate transporter receptor subunit TctC